MGGLNTEVTLRALVVEDSDDDFELLVREFERAGLGLMHRRVQTREEFKAALERRAWDVVISDHTLPSYGGLAALADLRATGEDIPFILVSGTIGEAVAVTAMRAGAQDYVLKNDLTRLPAAVVREVREASRRAEQKKMREQLMVSERMASVGLVAAGVAHEINNPVAVALANADFAVRTLLRIAADAQDVQTSSTGWVDWLSEQLSEVRGPLDDVQNALARIRDIVRDVKFFSRPYDEARGPVDVRRVIDSSCRMASIEIAHRAQLIKDYGDVPLVDASESRLAQVVLNLLVNAAHAMTERSAGRKEIRVATGSGPDGRAVISVSDTGSGIAPENLERIFEPFFTTKPVGVGTGLGLAICRRIMSELGGDISVESKLGKGTQFRLSLPAASARERRSAPPGASPAVPLRGRVLVVDDEEALGRALQRSLAAQHDVGAVTSAHEALARITAGERFDALLSDLMMPEMSGMELHSRLRGVAPEQADRMIFLSGGAVTSAARDFLDGVPNPRMEKPVEHANLLAILAGFIRTGAK